MVLGISGDSPQKLKTWKEKRDLPYDLWSDPGLKVLEKWGALGTLPVVGIKTGRAKRSHWVIDEDGVVIDQQIGIGSDESVTLALASLHSMEHE